MVVICREVSKSSGRIAVYALDAEVTDELLFKLKMRAVFNPELRYFATTRARRVGIWRKDIEATLKRKAVTPEALNRLGGIVEI